MRPVQVSVDVSQSPEVVYDYLDVLANHEQFTDHLLKDWHLQGPARGVGAKAQVKAVIGGRTNPLEMEVIEAQAPTRTVERSTGAGGRRVTLGTYTLTPGAGGGTRVVFESSWVKAPWNEQLAAPMVRSMTRKANEQALRRLAERLDHVGSEDRSR